jgi:hypothetical protein
MFYDIYSILLSLSIYNINVLIIQVMPGHAHWKISSKYLEHKMRRDSKMAARGRRQKVTLL